ncbi:cell division protein FtsA [Candidatus Uhrbacteria bacterium]|nr:cell division protein FtsA [Candidatus Uhrbacteria bacterium]
MKDAIITGIDMGSTMARIVTGQVYSDSGEKKLQIIAAAEHPSEGIHKGTITSIDHAVASLTSCLEKAERMSGVPIESAWVGVSGAHIISQQSKGVVAVGKINGEISRQDFERAIEAARAIATPANYDILHVIPRTAIIDGQITIKDPVGMTGTRLEVDTLIIQGFSTEIRNVTKCVYRTGLEIEDLVFSILATAEATLTNRQKDIGVVLVNIGGATTSLVVFEEGELLHAAVLPMGSNHITSDIALGLQISIDTAEKIKLEYGTLNVRDVSKKSEINLSHLTMDEEGLISQRYVSQIIEARVEEIFDKIELELKKIGRNGVLPGGIVLTGGGSKLSGMIDLAKKRLKLPACYATMKNLVNPIEKVFDQSFTTAVGLAYWGLSFHQQKTKQQHFLFHNENTSDVRSRVKKWFKTLLP